MLREHKQADRVVLDAVLRSFPPVEPVVLKWEFPLWKVDNAADPTAIKSSGDEKQRLRDESGKASIMALVATQPRTEHEVRDSASMGLPRAGASCSSSSRTRAKSASGRRRERTKHVANTFSRSNSHDSQKVVFDGVGTSGTYRPQTGLPTVGRSVCTP